MGCRLRLAGFRLALGFLHVFMKMIRCGGIGSKKTVRFGGGAGGCGRLQEDV